MVRSAYWVSIFTCLIVIGCAERSSFDRLSYFPHVVGTSWDFSGPLGEVVVVDSQRVGSSEFRLDFDGDGYTRRLQETFVVSRNQIYWKEYDLSNFPLISFEPPLPILPPSLRAGDSLVVDSREQWRDSIGTSFSVRSVVTVLGLEDVAVPAGDFENCVHLRQALVYEDESVPHLFTWIELWYAKNTGWVKYDSETGSGELLSAVIGDKRYP